MKIKPILRTPQQMRTAGKVEPPSPEPVENSVKAETPKPEDTKKVRYFICFAKSASNGSNPSFDNKVISLKREIRSDADIKYLEKKLLEESKAYTHIRVTNFIKLDIPE